MLDTDLSSVQEARKLLERGKVAQKELEKMTQGEIDNIVRSMAEGARHEAHRLAEMAVEETGFGKLEDKSEKNLFAANAIYESIKDLKTIGIIDKDDQNQVWKVARPVGLIAGIVPSTNPTSTTIFKSLIAVKSGNAIVFGPHPSAILCTAETVKVMEDAAKRAGAPEGLIACVSQSTLASANELMTHELTDIILATGGPAMVKAAYSSGKPAYGVGPGNVPAYIHESANLAIAARHISESKTFDYGTICASEQSIVVDRSIKRKIISELEKQGAYFLDNHDKERVASIILKNGGLNSEIVGKSAQIIAEKAGIVVPPGTTILIAEESNIGKPFPFSMEKLAPILAFYTVENWKEASVLCAKLLEFGGLGHTLGIHCEDKQIIESFGLEQPVSRLIINSGTTFGGIGATTSIQPSLTLGCGSYGNNITSDNIGPEHLINIKRVAYGIREMKKREVTAIAEEQVNQSGHLSVSREEIAEIIKGVLQEMKL